MLPNNKYIVRRPETNKTQLLQRICWRKFTPQAPLAHTFVRETDWQKYDQMPTEHDDHYSQSWNTNFGPNPFEDNHPEYSQKAEDIAYLSIPVPENNHPPSRENSQYCGGSPVEQTTVPEAETHSEFSQKIHTDEVESSQKSQAKEKYTTKNPENPKKPSKKHCKRTLKYRW